MVQKRFVVIVIIMFLLGVGIVFAAEPVQLKTLTKVSPNLSIAKATLTPVKQDTTSSGTFYLIRKISQTGVIKTGNVDKEAKFQGEIRFIATQGKNGELILTLDRLNLISEGVMTDKGKSGQIGLSLEKSENPVRYDPKTGKMSAEFTSTLHYGLIDETFGFIEPKSEEEDVFLSYTETMKGKMTGTFPEQMKPQDNGKVSLSSDLVYTLEKEKLGLITEMRFSLSMADLLWSRTAPSDVLIVQPVFIGSGPSDPDATGWVYNPLIRNASTIWGRCGTVRCIIIRTNDPIYIDNDDYRVLDNARNAPAEATALRSEVDIPDAVEIFVVDRWDPYYDGGGATWGSGTSLTKIITCDQQLDVPCPIPTSVCSSGSCGAVNYFHLGHELGHSINLAHYGEAHDALIEGTSGSIMDPSGFCYDNPAVQSAKNCRSASSPLFTSGRSICTKSPDIMD